MMLCPGSYSPSQFLTTRTRHGRYFSHDSNIWGILSSNIPRYSVIPLLNRHGIRWSPLFQGALISWSPHYRGWTLMHNRLKKGRWRSDENLEDVNASSNSFKDVLYIKPACNTLSSIVALWDIAGQRFSAVMCQSDLRLQRQNTGSKIVHFLCLNV